jgi:hypothetical protein
MIQKYRTLIVAVFAAIGLLVVGVTVANGAVKPDCTNLQYPLCPRSVAATQVVDNSLPKSKIVPADRDAFLKDTNSLASAYYSVAFYDVGNTNAGAIATVACKKTTDTAINGGVQVVDTTKNTPVSSSFPGRMNWNVVPNAPLPNRLDGWIVQFGGNAGAVSDKDPLKVKIWALCVPGLNIPVTQTYLQSADN